MITDGTLYDRIIKLRPSLTDADFKPNNGTVLLEDLSDGKGAFIASWTHATITRPTDDEIKAVVLQDKQSKSNIDKSLQNDIIRNY